MHEASVNSAIDSNPVKSGEEGIVDLVYPLSINGKRSLDGENIEIDDDAVIYNSEGDSYIRYKKIVYELRCDSIELRSVKQIKNGVAASQDQDTYPEIIKTFDTKEEALSELKKYHTEIRELSHHMRYYEVTEYYVEENTYDQDGENVKGGDIWGISNITSDDMEKYNLNKTAEVQHDDRTIK